MEDIRMTLNAEDVTAAEQIMKDSASLDSQQSNTTDVQETLPPPGAKKSAQKRTTAKAETTIISKQKDSPIEKLLTDYRKRYPNNMVFHVTSDMQVFLESDRNMAVLHQSTLKSGELTTL